MNLKPMSLGQTQNVRKEVIENQKPIKGYKVFDPDWRWCFFQYQVGECYEIDNSTPDVRKGHLFFQDKSTCASYFLFDQNLKIAEVTAYDIINNNGKEYYTSKIRIDRELTWHDILKDAHTPWLYHSPGRS